MSRITVPSHQYERYARVALAFVITECTSRRWSVPGGDVSGVQSPWSRQALHPPTSSGERGCVTS